MIISEQQILNLIIFAENYKEMLLQTGSVAKSCKVKFLLDEINLQQPTILKNIKDI